MIHRTMNAELFNSICNHPEVRPYLGGEGPIDTTTVLSNSGNYGLFGEGGGFILVAGPAASFEVHSQFVPEGRKHSFEAMRAGMDYMFTRTNALQLTTFLPDDNPAARGLALKGGFKEWFRRLNHPIGPGIQAKIDIDDWIANAAELEPDGERFHDALEKAKAEAGSELAVHAHDPVHERYVGAASRMFSRGQCQKAQAIYNRWAENAGYAQIRLISESPPVVDAIDALVTLDGDHIHVLKVAD
jgi:hypothetical protein